MYSALDFYLKASDKNDAIQELLNNTELYDFSDMIVPIGRKNNFAELASVISRLPETKIRAMGFKLLEWFKDLNWPGMKSIEAALRSLPHDDLRIILESGLVRASNENDVEWRYNLIEVFSDILES